MTARWDSDTTQLFVRQYREKECLWNWACRDYMDKRARERACKEIQEVMGIPGFGVPEIKKKIRTLRSTYSQELKKIKIAKKHNKLYIPQLKWFKDMHEFIQRCMRFGQSGRMQQLRNNAAAIDTEDVPDIIQIKTEPLNDSEFIDEEFNGSISHGNLDEDYIMRNPDHEHSLLEPKLDPHDDENSQSPISDSFSALNNVEIKQDVMETEDEFDIFGRHIAVQLRQLRIVNALKAQSKIQAILTELRIEEISKE